MTTIRIVDLPPEPPIGTVIEYDDRSLVRMASSLDRPTFGDGPHYESDTNRWLEGDETSSAHAWWTWGEVIGQAIDQATNGRYVERAPGDAS